MQTVSVCSYYERQTAEWQNNNNKRSVFLKLAPFLSDGVELGNLHVNLRCSETEGKELVER